MIGRLGLLAPLAWRNLWRNPRRTGITLAVVAIGVWSILSFDVMLKAFADSSREATLRLLTGEGQIHAKGYLDDPDIIHSMPPASGPLLTALGSHAVGAWAQRVRIPAVIQSEYRTRAVTLLGVAPHDERKVSDLPGQVTLGRYLNGPDDAGLVIGRDLADQLKTRLGKRVIVMAQAADGHLAESGYVVVGLFDGTKPVQDAFVFTGLGPAQANLGLGRKVSEIAFFAGAAQPLDQTVAALRRAAPSLDIQPWTRLSPLAYTIESFSRSYIAVWLAIMFVLMAIGVVNTQLMAVFERTREFGLLQALGMRPGPILLQVTVESALLIGLGVVAGIVLMMVTLAPFRHGLDLGFLAAGAEMAGVGRVLHPQLDLADTVRFSLIIWVLGVVTALWPARVAARANPAVAMSQL